MTPNFLEEETRCGYKVSAQMKKVWAIEIDLVQELFRVCDKYNLKCWLDSGSLIGAVRHQGFIPWDDDMDVCLFRSDYDKLVSIASEEFKDPYLLQTAYTDKNYVRGHAQLRNIHTTAILPNDIPQQFNQGVFIDVFVLDGVSDSCQYLKQQKRKLTILNRLMYGTFSAKLSLKHPRSLFISLLSRMLFGFNNRHIGLYRKYENILRAVKIEDVEQIAPLGFRFDTKKQIRNKHSYDETILLDFEYTKFPAPAGYHEILSNEYGDYMNPAQIPTKHGRVIFDTERPAEQILYELRGKK